MENIKKDPNNGTLYASSYIDNDDDPGVGLGVYVSTDGGDTWALRVASGMLDTIAHPTSANVAVTLTTDVFTTSDAFASTIVELNLDRHAGVSEFYSSAEFINSTTLLVGSTSGNLYRTTNFSSHGVGVTWETINFPGDDCWIQGIKAHSASDWTVACWIADGSQTRDSLPGLYRTTNAGTSWIQIDSEQKPTQAPFRMKSDPNSSDNLFIGYWGSGLYKYTRP